MIEREFRKILVANPWRIALNYCSRLSHPGRRICWPRTCGGRCLGARGRCARKCDAHHGTGRAATVLDRGMGTAPFHVTDVPAQDANLLAQDANQSMLGYLVTCWWLARLPFSQFLPVVACGGRWHGLAVTAKLAVLLPRRPDS
jgi:hypothetical protein